MTLNFKKNFLRVVVLAICLDVAGCTKEGGLTPRVLDGKWDLQTINAVTVPAGEVFTWEFEKDGEFTFCYDGDCYKGDWEWKNSKTELEIVYFDDFGDRYTIDFEVDVLDKTTLKGDWNYDGDIFQLEFERDD